MRWVLALLMVAALARAAPLEVGKAPVDMLHAERIDITDRFEVVRVGLARSLLDARASGEVEISEVPLPAQSRLVLGDWAYTVELREREPAGVPEGLFEVRLELSGRPVGAVRLLQASGNPLVKEGATVSFGIGKDLPSAPLLFVGVRELPRGPTFELTTAVNSSFAYVWRDDAQAENPSLSFAFGLGATFVLTNGEATSPHNFQILDGSDPPPTTGDLVAVGDEETLTWTPAAPGTYVYRCQYHPTMKGNIEVTE